MATISPYVKFTNDTIDRAKLNNAPYNPRRITDKTRRKLKKNISKVGLLEPIVWNKQTGNIVSGHQRIAILDALHGNPDYAVPVATVDLDPKTEKEQNIFFNNPDAQGEFDDEKLFSLIRDENLDHYGAGWDADEMYQMLGADITTTADIEAEDLEKLAEQYRDLERGDRNRRKKNDGETDFYLVAVFKSHEERKDFTDSLQWDDNRYIDGRILAEIIQDAQNGRKATRRPDTTTEEKTRPLDTHEGRTA